MTNFSATTTKTTKTTTAITGTAAMSTKNTSVVTPKAAPSQSTRRVSFALFLGGFVLLAAATGLARDVPDKTIPASVLLEMRVLEGQFKAALRSDCAPGRCFVKGCVYQDHITLDQPRTTSLPGLPAEEGPGSVVPQEYLTRALCEFTHEKTVRKRNVGKLSRRLEKRLSRGWLTVAIAAEALEPIPKSLSEPEPDAEPPEQEPEAEPEPPPEPEELTFALALRQLWQALLPHSPWMSAIFLLTLAVLVLIWAGRRLGTPSLEDKMMEAQLQNAPAAELEPAPEAVEAEVLAPAPADEDFAQEQETLWNERLDRISHEEDDVISRLLREWLKAGDYATLARALLVFGDRVSPAFSPAPELALKKVEFAAYFRDVDESTLPSRAQFFRHLNQQAMASLLLSQDDVQLYRSLREDFGSSGFVGLMRAVPARYGALLFALMDYEQKQEVAPLLSSAERISVAGELLSSTRIALNESEYLAACVDTVRDGDPIPEAPEDGTVPEHGPAVDSASALSILLPHISGAEREALFNEQMQRHGGALPRWFDNIAFNHMLTSLPEEVRNDLLLEVDIRGLAAWLQTQPVEWRQVFVRELSGPLRNALSQNANASTQEELFRWAKRGQDGLVTAFKSAYARRGVRFVDLVA